MTKIIRIKTILIAPTLASTSEAAETLVYCQWELKWLKCFGENSLEISYKMKYTFISRHGNYILKYLPEMGKNIHR